MQGFLLLQESLLKKRITGSFRAKAQKGKIRRTEKYGGFPFSYRLPDGTPWVYPGLNALVSEQYRFMPLIMVKLLVYSRF